MGAFEKNKIIPRVGDYKQKQANKQTKILLLKNVFLASDGHIMIIILKFHPDFLFLSNLDKSAQCFALSLFCFTSKTILSFELLDN